MGKEAKWVVRLDAPEQQELETVVATPRAAAERVLRARVLLKADEGAGGPAWPDTQIADAFEISVSKVQRLRQRLVEEGLAAALVRHPSPQARPRKLDGAQEARLVTLACSAPPAGRTRWTLQLLADQLVVLKVVDAISDETVRVTLKKNALKPWRERQWVIPPEQNAAFVCAMEDVLEVYQRPYDATRPVVCLDEASKQLVQETRPHRPLAPGHPRTVDYEYERNGTANLFMLFEPLAGRRQVEVTARRTALDYARVVQELVDVRYPTATTIVLVHDNLNTHVPASLYAAFPPAEARRLLAKLEIHYTPKHGSWLNMAETELSILSRQCLRRRIPEAPTLVTEVAAWETARGTERRARSDGTSRRRTRASNSSASIP